MKAGSGKTGMLFALSLILVSCGAPGKTETEAASEQNAAVLETENVTTENASEKTDAAKETSGGNFMDMQATMYVKDKTGTGVNVREKPSLQSAVEAVLKNGDSVKVVGTSDSWYEIDLSGNHGYVAKSLLTEQVPETSGAAEKATAESTAAKTGITEKDIALTDDLKYAEFSKIHSGTAKLYKNNGAAHGNITVCVNAGHGTKGGESVKTQSHPDGTGKVTGGTNAAGAKTSMAVSSGMEFTDGTAERTVTLKEAMILKQKLLDSGYSVLMIRESEDVQLDNIARTVLANNYADCHIAVHWDSTSSNKGAYYMAAPSGSYRSMEPVASTWKKSAAFGGCLISGLKSSGIKIFEGGSLEQDLTQTSYSSVPSVDIELGDKASDHSEAVLEKTADALLQGVELYFTGQ